MLAGKGVAAVAPRSVKRSSGAPGTAGAAAGTERCGGPAGIEGFERESAGAEWDRAGEEWERAGAEWESVGAE
jgi:hypothetical protein